MLDSFFKSIFPDAGRNFGGTRNESADSHPAGKKRISVETPNPDCTVSLDEEPSLLSPDFNQKRAMTEAKFNAYQKGMEQMKRK